MERNLFTMGTGATKITQVEFKKAISSYDSFLVPVTLRSETIEEICNIADLTKIEKYNRIAKTNSSQDVEFKKDGIAGYSSAWLNLANTSVYKYRNFYIVEYKFGLKMTFHGEINFKEKTDKADTLYKFCVNGDENQKIDFEAHVKKFIDTNYRGMKYTKNKDCYIFEVDNLSRFNTIDSEPKTTTIDDILNDDDFNLLGGDTDEEQEALKIFDLNHVSKNPTVKKEMPDYIGDRKKYDLTKNEIELFGAMQKEIKNKTLVKSDSKDFKEGDMFVLGGVKGYIKLTGRSHSTDKTKELRMILVFENGTTSFMLEQSFKAGLYKRDSYMLKKVDNYSNDAFTPQTKAKDYKGGYFNTKLYTSLKKDGIYTQLHTNRNGSTLFTSTGQKLGTIKTIVTPSPQILECEYCVDGKRTVKSRNMANSHIRKFKANNNYDLLEHGKLFVHDIITNDIFEDRLKILKTISSPKLEILEHKLMKVPEILIKLKKVVADGEEGLIGKSPNHKQIGKITDLSLKFKPILTADLEVFNKINGYVWGKDKNGIVGKVRVAKDVFDEIVLGDTIEIQYESIGKAFIQARFLDLRFDRRA